jgi:hypothetical protein
VDKAAVNVVDHLFGIDFSSLDGLIDLIIDNKFDMLNLSKLEIMIDKSSGFSTLFTTLQKK